MDKPGATLQVTATEQHRTFRMVSGCVSAGSSPAEGAEAPGGELSEKRQVVVVDDQDSVRALVRALLGSDDRFEVVGEATDGAAAFDVIDELRPDLIVLDLEMPGIDGIAVLERITAQHPDVAVVVHSELLARREEALANGAAAFVSKSQPNDELLEVLARCDREAPGLRALRESDAQTHRFLEALPVGIAIVEQGRMVFINRLGREVLGTGPSDALDGANILEHFHLRKESTGEPYPFDELPIVRALFHGETSSADDVVVTRLDGLIPVETYAAPVAGVLGDRQYAVAAFTDVSERRAQDARLARALASLESANETLMEFAAVAAHDLAAPLRAISGFAALLEEQYGELLPAEARTWVGFMVSETGRMREFIDDLLAYARAGAAADAASEAALGEIARQAAEDLAQEIERTGASVVIDELPVVPGDPARLGQVFQNLLSNALKFTAPDRAPIVRIGACADGATWVITVEDNGVGVRDEERSRVFSPFSRGAAGADRSGHGLGLTICRRIVERHGGRIWVDDAPAGGSAFRFSLPRSLPRTIGERAG